MKRKFLAVAIVLCMTLVLAMTACTPTYTLTLYDQDGKTVLGTVEAKEGSAPVKLPIRKRTALCLTDGT